MACLHLRTPLNPPAGSRASHHSPHLLLLAPLLGVVGFPMPPGRPLPGCIDGTAVGPPPLMAEAEELAKGEVATPDGDHLPSSTL